VPKLKTYKAAAKRFRITGRGKPKRRKQGSRHLRRKRSKRSRRESRGEMDVSPADIKRIERLLGRRIRRKKQK
jgi:large subunit ribosomal protein L35